MIKFKEFMLLLCISIFLVSCDYHTQDPDNAYNYINQSDLFKLSMNERLNFGNLDVSGANKTHSQSVTVTNTGKFAMQVDVPETGSEDLTITTADNFANPLRPGMSYNFQVNYAPKTFGDKSVNIDMSEYLSLPKNNFITAGPGQGTITSADVYKATFMNEMNEVFDGILKIEAKYSETTSPKITADIGTEINFGNLGANNSAIQDIMLTNIGDGNAIISNIEVISNNKIFSVILPETFKGHFQPNKQESFQIKVSTGDLVGGASGKLIISSNSINSPYEIDLKVYGKQPNIDFGNSGGQTGSGQVGGTDDNGNELGEGEVAGSIDFDTNTIDFGLVSLNKPRLQKLSFMNNDESIFSIESISATGADLSIEETKSTCGNAVLNKGDSCDIYISFSPKVAQIYTGIVQINSRINNGDLFSIDFTTTGEGIEPKISVANELNFNRVNVGEQSVKNIVIKNIGKDILDITSIQFSSESSSLSELNDDIFMFDAASCVKSLKYNEECSFEVIYTPSFYGEVKETIVIQSNDTEQTVTLIGIGSGVSLSTNNEIDLGSLNKITEYDLELFNIGYDPITINTAEFVINKNFNIKENLCSIIEAEKSCVIKAEFTPPNDGSAVTDVLNITFNDTNRYNVVFAGSGAQPKLELSITNGEILDFGRVGVNSSGTQTLFFHNTGNAPLALSNFTIDNIHGHNEYSITENTCKTEISPDGMCEITLAVVPIHGGTINDKISFKSNELTNNQYVINLTAEAIFSDYSLSASSLNFGEKYIYPEQTYNKDIIITNTGTEPITIKDAVVINGFFDVINNCSTLNTYETCNINVKVTPSSAGNITDTLRITTDVATAPIKEVALSVKGLNRDLSVSPNILDFGNLTIGVVSDDKSITITNTGNINLDVLNLAVTEPFNIAANTCIYSLQPNASCNVMINVSPINAGKIDGILTIDTNALKESSKRVELIAKGQLESELSISVSELNFGEKYIYPEQSHEKVFTISNIGTEPFNISSIEVSNNMFQIEHLCSDQLNGGDSCSGKIIITPTTAGTIEGNLIVTTDASINPIISIPVMLTGLDKDFTISPNLLDFKTIAINSSSELKTVTIRNTGNMDLAISGISATSPFSIASKTCGTSLAANATCTVNVQVTPNTVGSLNGRLTITTDALRETTKTVELAVVGQKPSELSVNVSSMEFGEKYIYPSQSYNKPFTITNVGTMPLTITSINSSNSTFKVNSSCVKELVGGASCSGTVSVTPSSIGDINGTLTISSNASVNKTKTISLHIKGLDKTFTVSPTSLNFGSVPVGSASTTKAVTIRNTGNVNLAISGISATSPFSVASKTCGTSLAANASCTVNVQVTPNAAGSNTGALNIVTDALRESTKSVALSVTGTTSSYSISTTSLDFGTVEYGQKSAVKTITVTNTGSLPITFSAPTISSPYSIESNTCNTLDVGAQCTIGVAVTADRVGTISGTVLDIWSDAAVEASKSIDMKALVSTFYISSESETNSISLLISKGTYEIVRTIGTSSYITELGSGMCRNDSSIIGFINLKNIESFDNDMPNQTLIINSDTSIVISIPNCNNNAAPYCTGENNYSPATLLISKIQ